MANSVGDVNYEVNLEGSSSGLVKTIQNATKAMQSLEKSVNTLSGKVSGSFKEMETSTKSLASQNKNLKGQMDSTNKALGSTGDLSAKLINAFGGAERQVGAMTKRMQDLGMSKDSVSQLNTVLTRYKEQMASAGGSTKQTALANQNFKNSIQKIKQSTSDFAKSSAESQRALMNMRKSMSSAKNEVAMLTSRMKAMGEGDEAINPLSQALRQYKVDLERAGTSQQAQVAAKERYKAAIGSVKNKMEEQRKSIRGTTTDQSAFIAQMQNSTKAVQMALGPLSGVAARMTAFNALVRTNTIGIASFTASIVGLVVATQKIVQVGIEYERQMLGLESSIEATGRSAQTTAGELNEMARAIASATLTSSQAARQSINILLTFQNITVDTFDQIVTAAQGVATAFGSDITSSTRLLARAIEQPSSSLDSLRRVGIQFNDQQKETIKLFEETGQVAKAQGVILDRVAVFSKRAEKESEGLAGQLDAVSDNMATLTENISAEINTNERLVEVYKKVNAGLVSLTENTSGIAAVLEGFSSVISIISGALSFLGNNIEFVGAVLTAVFIGGLTKVLLLIAKWSTGLLGIIPLITGVAGALKTQQVAADGTAVATTRLSRSIKLLKASFGALSLLAGAVSFVLMKIAASSYEAERSGKALEAAQKALSGSSKEARKAMDDLEQSTGNVTQGMVEQAKIIQDDYSLRVRDALAGAKAEFSSFEESVDSASKAASKLAIKELKEQSPNKMFMQERLMESMKISQDVEQSYITFTNKVKEAFDTIKGGGTLAQGEIQALKEEVRDVGADSGFIDLLEQLSDLNSGLIKSEARVENLGEALRNNTINAPALLKGITENFSDMIYPIKQIKEKELVGLQQEMLNTGDTAKRVVDEMFSDMENRIFLDIQAGGGTEEAFKLLDQLEQRKSDAVKSLKELEQTWNEMRLEGASETIKELAYELRLMGVEASGAESQIHAVKRAIDVQSNVQGFVDGLDLAKGSTEDFREKIELLREELEALGVAKFINLSEVENVEQLKAALEEAYGALYDHRVAMKESKRATKGAEKSQKELKKSVESLNDMYGDYTDTLRLHKAMQEGGTGAIRAMQELQEQEAIVEEVAKAFDELSDEALAEFIRQSGLTVRAGETVEQAMVRMGLAARDAKAEIDAFFEADKNTQAFKKDMMPETDKIFSTGADRIFDAVAVGDFGAEQMAREQMAKEQMGIGKEADDLVKEPFTDLEKLQEQMEERKAVLADFYGEESEAYAQHLRQLEKTAEGSKMFLQVSEYANTAVDLMGGALDAMKAMGRESTKEFQIMAIAQATIAQGLAIAKAYSESGNIYVAMAQAALAGAAVGAQIAQIKSANYATGGYVSGSGTGTSDSIPASLSNGEYVIRAAAVRKLGLENLEKLNNGIMPFAEGGLAGAVAVPSTGPSKGSGDVIVNVIDQRSGNDNSPVETKDGGIDDQGRRQLTVLIKDTVKNTFRTGEMDGVMAGSYGVQRAGKRR